MRTELRGAYNRRGTDKALDDPAVYDPKKFGRAGMERLKESVRAKIHVCGCTGRAEG